MRVLVCGGRDFNKDQIVFSELDRHNADWGPFKVVIDGGATGADHWAGVWAEERGIARQTFLAEWKRLGNAAGPIRNQRMIDEGKPDLIIAFPGGRGTRDMISRANKAKLQMIWVIIDDQATPSAQQ